MSGFLTELLEKPVTVQDVLESEGNPTLPITVAGKAGKAGKSGKARKVENTGEVGRLDLKKK